MSEYTTTVRYICEFYNNQNKSTGYSTIDNVIENSYSKIFDFSYPIFDENYKSILEKKILKYFYLYEICCETVSEWKLYLCNKLNEIMPYYNKLYESEKIKIEPLITNDIITTHIGNKNESNESNKNSSYTITGNSNDTITDNSTTTNNEKATKTGNNTTTSTGENKEIKNSTGENKTTIVGSGEDKLVRHNEHSENTEKTNIFSDYPQVTSDMLNGTYASGKNYEKGTSGSEQNQSDTTTKTENTTNTVNTSLNDTNTITASKNDSETINESNIVNRGENIKRSSTSENTRNENSTNTESINSTNTGNENYTTTSKGFNGINQSELLIKYRESFINIDRAIIDDLRCLFFTLY